MAINKHILYLGIPGTGATFHLDQSNVSQLCAPSLSLQACSKQFEMVVKFLVPFAQHRCTSGGERTRYSSCFYIFLT